MATVTISEQDRVDSETYLESYLSNKLPSGDFSRGTALRDLTLGAMSYVVALLRAETALVKARSSIRQLTLMADTVDRDDAADDAVSNWFISRKQGRQARGTILIHLSADTVVTIPTSTRFFYDTNTAFTPDSSVDLVIPTSQIVKQLDASGQVVDRYVRVNVIAAAPGAAYNVVPSNWLSADRFNTFVTYVNSLDAFTGGDSVETTDALLARASSAITVRDLSSAKAIRTTLLEAFTDLDDVTVVGAGDPEMQRDLLPTLGTSPVHMGGCIDAYIRSPVVSAVFEGLLGGTYTLAQGTVTHLTDAAVVSFVSAGVTTGCVVRVTNAAAGEPTLFPVAAVQPGFLTVSSRTPFPAARTGVWYTIGTNHPTYDNVQSLHATGASTNTISSPSSLVLPSVPLQTLTRVMLVDDAQNPVELTRGSGSTPDAAEYVLSYASPQLAHSAYQDAILTVGSVAGNGSSIRVEYSTPSNFAAVHTYVTDPMNKPSGASLVVRGMYVARVSVHLQYTLRSVTSSAFDPVAAATALAAFIDAFPTTEALTLTEITGFLKSNYPQISTLQADGLYAGPLTYTLECPDGKLASYVSHEVVSIDPALETTPSSPVLANPAAYGISARTTLFSSAPALITLTAA